MQVANMPLEREQDSRTLPAEYVTARSRLCRLQTCHSSVSRTAAHSPLSTWQPDHVYAGCKHATWAWAGQPHTSCWVRDSQITSMQVANMPLEREQDSRTLPAEYLTARSRLCMPLEREQESSTLPAEYLTARSRLCRVADMPLKHANMSVSRTAAHFPLSTWQPDHVYAGCKHATWAWAGQPHTPRWVPDSQITSVQVANVPLEREQDSRTLPAEYLTARSRLCRLQTCHLSVRRTAAHSPLSTWQPDHICVGLQTCHFNKPTWAWAGQPHTSRWVLDSQITFMQVANMPLEREQDSRTLPVEYLTARSRLCRLQTCHSSVSRTAAHSPLSTWQPDHVYAGCKHATWAWEGQPHTPRWVPDSQITSV